MYKDKRKQAEKQEQSRQVENQLVKRLWPVLVTLNDALDRRLVKTFLGLVMAITLHRHCNNGLLLSELGGYLLGAEHARAGTKRISNLVHSEMWKAEIIEDYFWNLGTQGVEELWEQGERPLVIWDESVLEKPESLQAEGLCAVRSTKAVRLKRIKLGFFNPPDGRPIFLPGFHCLKILVVGRQGNPILAPMRWWTTRGEQQTQKRAEEGAVLAHIDQLWGKEVLHIWDRGFAGNPWLTQVLFCVGQRITFCWMSRDNYISLEKSPKASVPGIIACYGMRAVGKLKWQFVTTNLN